MLLAIDIGNTNIVYGLFEGERLVKTFRCTTDRIVFPKLADIHQVIVASVVPKINPKIRRKYGVKALFVNCQNIPINVTLKDKAQIGADRLVNAYAAKELFGFPVIVIDFGTATTFDVVDKKGDYIGGVIAPGVYMARDALYLKTAKLPKVEIKKPANIIGINTISAMQSGLVFGYVAMVEGMVKKLKAQSSKLKGAKVVATGGLAGTICKLTRVVDRIDKDLTLKGLRMLAEYVEMGKE